MNKRPLLVDTQLLVLLVAGLAAPSLIAKHKRTRHYTSTDFKVLLDLVGYQPRFRYCPHVAAEASNLLGQYGEPDRTTILTVLQALLNNAEEVSVASRVAMEAREFLRLGLTDAAQLALCTIETVLLTDDELLYRAAHERGVAVLYFTDEKMRRDRHLA